jgi:hypothetical protein
LNGLQAQRRVVSVLNGDRPLCGGAEIDPGSVDGQTLFVNLAAVLQAVNAKDISV